MQTLEFISNEHNFLSEVVPYITYQKERYDGSGEPEGLKGQSIPFGSRIIAVADAYCAMTSDRPYRSAMPVDKALDIMKLEASVKWDPVVINALERLSDKFIIVRCYKKEPSVIWAALTHLFNYAKRHNIRY